MILKAETYSAHIVYIRLVLWNTVRMYLLVDKVSKWLTGRQEEVIPKVSTRTDQIR